MNHKIISVGMMLMGALCACEKTEVKEIWEDRYVNQPMDTVRVIDNYHLTDRIVRTAADMDDRETLAAVSLFLDGEELYIANEGGKSVDVFDAGSMEYRRSIFHGERTEAHDIYVEGEHLFVAAGNMREVQIFDKQSGDYLTRLGTGVYYGNVSWAGCVAATPRFVFVRDSKETNIRVFDRDALVMTQTNNNTVFAKLSTGSHFIGSKQETTQMPYDMEIIGDSLYAFLHAPGQIYSYALSDIENLKNDTPAQSTTLNGGMKVYSAVLTPKNTVWVAMGKDSKTSIAEMSLEDFQRRNFDSLLRNIDDSSQFPLPSCPIIANYDERLYYVNGDRIERCSIVNIPFYVLRPKGDSD